VEDRYTKEEYTYRDTPVSYTKKEVKELYRMFEDGCGEALPFGFEDLFEKTKSLKECDFDLLIAIRATKDVTQYGPNPDKIQESCYTTYVEEVWSKKDIYYLLMLPFEDIPLYATDEYAPLILKWRLSIGK
jgi:hypothetical protein